MGAVFNLYLYKFKDRINSVDIITIFEDGSVTKINKKIPRFFTNIFFYLSFSSSDSHRKVSIKSKIKAPKRTNKRKSVDMNERVDQVLESCIEVESNRRLLDENLNYLTLTFKKSEMEKKVRLFEFNLDR